MKITLDIAPKVWSNVYVVGRFPLLRNLFVAALVALAFANAARTINPCAQGDVGQPDVVAALTIP